MSRAMRYLIISLAIILGGCDLIDANAQRRNVPFTPRAAAGPAWYEGYLISSYPLNSDANDEYGTNNLTNNGVTFSSTNAVVGNAGQWGVAEDDNLVLTNANAGDFLFGDEGFTTCAWVNRNSGTAGHILGIRDAVGGGATQFSYDWRYISTDAGRFAISSDGSNQTTKSGPGATDGVTFHLCMSHDPSDDELCTYLDGGTAQCAAHAGGAFASSTADFVIGALNSIGQNAHRGQLDEVRIYGGSVADIETDTGVNVATCEYNSGSGRSLSTLGDC